jgi:glycerol-3-phosphate O-acyltransferase/dihydroxyacetone phosphate acyltransferase
LLAARPSLSLVDLFAQAPDSVELLRLRDLLLSYAASLKRTSLTHVALAQAKVPLPSTLDPALPHPLPTRLRVVGQLVWATARSLSSLPFFAVPLVVHLPIYIVGLFSLRCSDLDEDKAQNKMAFGLITYVALFFTAWGFLYLTWFGAPLAVGIVWLFMVYHNTMIDDNCESSSSRPDPRGVRANSILTALHPYRQQVQSVAGIMARPRWDLGTSRQARSGGRHQPQDGRLRD